ncbi:MAG: flagellar hook-basal body complex protein [Proteobacteria bacterium]|nr:flagellar hook-basal body complex protein [Pseudomonadota bacterium]
MTISYTRAGQFGVDSSGYITNSNGQYLQTFPVDALGNVTSTSLNTTLPIQLPASTGAPRATSEVEIGLNIDASSTALDPTAFDPTSSTTFNHSTSTTVFDSLGASHVMTYYFVHDLPGSATNAANDPSGFSTGRLTEIDISEEGLIRATFSNGVSTPMGQIALAEFPNNQGLQNLGSSNWTETIDSGSVITGIAGSGRFGLVQSGALETANVDLTAQLVNLITAQRNFQANARSIETSNAITDTIIQIR